MTSKHFEAFAREIATITDSADAISMQRLVMRVAKEVNKHFDPDRFKARIKELRVEYLETIKDDGLPVPLDTLPGGRVLDPGGLSQYLEGYLKAQLEEEIMPWTKLADIIKTGIESWSGGAR